jgi:hypothetical protein
MSYEDWLKKIEILKNSNNINVMNEIENETNDNLNNMLEPKIIELIKYRLNNSIKKIINCLDEIYTSNDYLDLSLITFKKDIKFTYKLTNIKILNSEKRESLKQMIKNEVDNVYNILIKNADDIDLTGVLKLTIINNKMKWSE